MNTREVNGCPRRRTGGLWEREGSSGCADGPAPLPAPRASPSALAPGPCAEPAAPEAAALGSGGLARGCAAVMRSRALTGNESPGGRKGQLPPRSRRVPGVPGPLGGEARRALRKRDSCQSSLSPR